MSDKKLKEARRLFPGPRRRRPRDLTQQTDVPFYRMLRMTEEVKKKFFGYVSGPTAHET
jgi:hypothetical protein